jgi:hypothetical protein
MQTTQTEDHNMHPLHWYHLGAHAAPNPETYFNATLQDVPSIRAYVAGMTARLFGVDLSTAINS